jgi:hypothetical protein
MFAMIVAYISEEKSGNSCLGPLKSSRKCLPRTFPQVAMGRPLVLPRCKVVQESGNFCRGPLKSAQVP